MYLMVGVQKFQTVGNVARYDPEIVHALQRRGVSMDECRDFVVKQCRKIEVCVAGVTMIIDIFAQSRVTQLHVDEIKIPGLDPTVVEEFDNILMLSELHEDGYVTSFLVDIGLLSVTSAAQNLPCEDLCNLSRWKR